MQKFDVTAEYYMCSKSVLEDFTHRIYYFLPYSLQVEGGECPDGIETSLRAERLKNWG
jgi:hypothetical protein